ncbi:mycothiol system anti-sigma-R factor [Luteimicrobium sp. DT211]|uniref:mycothiol system anti-sigma-R factor n=1 Tax=Luteimicrobium sp. DT211 TaxID=3393412 RepID=UPI003CF2F721
MSSNVPVEGSGDAGVGRASAALGADAEGIEPIPHALGDGGECDHVVGHLWEYLDSEMTEDDAVRMRAHLAHCSPCLAELGLDELVRQLLRRSCADRAPATLRARLYAQFSVTSVIAREA